MRNESERKTSPLIRQPSPYRAIFQFVLHYDRIPLPTRTYVGTLRIQGGL